MGHFNGIRRFSLLIGDLGILYVSLFATLYLRYGARAYAEFGERHAVPFTVVFAIWILVFYVAGLYDIRRLRNNLEFFKTLSLALTVAGLLSVSFFYLLPAVGIAPRTNLFGVVLIFAILEILWRRSFNFLIASKIPPIKVLLIGSGEAAEKIHEETVHRPQLGYAIAVRLEEDPSQYTTENLKRITRERSIKLLVIPAHASRDEDRARALYELVRSGIEVRDVPAFYEQLFRAVPLAEISESWFLENIMDREKFYDRLKRAAEFVVALTLQIVLLPLEIAIALLVKLTSRGPAIFKQVRIGKNDKPFTLYKFRSMRALAPDGSAEMNGAEWKQAGPRDPRLTVVGRILVTTHLDELPQLWNIMRGELSFVGPRPERPEFVKLLEKKIPYYEIRHLIQPGVTGWAQIHYRYGSSIEDAYEKLQYDIYYLKNRSLVLDTAICIKTLKTIFFTPR